MTAQLNDTNYGLFLHILEDEHTVTYRYKLDEEAAFHRAWNTIIYLKLQTVKDLDTGKEIDIHEFMEEWAETSGYATFETNKVNEQNMGIVTTTRSMGYPLQPTSDPKWNWYTIAVDKGFKRLVENPSYNNLEEAQKIFIQGMLDGYVGKDSLEQLADRMSTMILTTLLSTENWADETKLNQGGIKRLKDILVGEWKTNSGIINITDIES